MIQKPLDRIETGDIDSLVANEVREGRTLEYKQALPNFGLDQEKVEFLADVSSFANASGGDILYGVEERRENGKTTGIPEKATGLAGLNADQEVRRLDSMIRDGIQPRIAGVHIRPVEGFPSGPVLLVRIQKSYAAPHMVTFKNLSRFYSRNSAGKYQLDVGEIRAAFTLSEALPERIRRFRAERLARIAAGETPGTLHDGPKVVLHLVPFSSLDPTNQVDVELVSAQAGNLTPLYSSGPERRFNFDGFLTHNTDQKSGVCHSYLQFFRSGAIEAVDSRILITRAEDKSFPARPVQDSLMEGVASFLAAYKALQVEPPIVVMVSLLDVRGFYIQAGQFKDAKASFDRETLPLPDLLVEDLAVNVPVLLKPAFDAMWQASGWRRCFNLDKDGNRVNSDSIPYFPD